MKVLVLGSAAHGGGARWICGCPRCLRAGPGGEPGHARTRSALAVSADGQHWALVNASPDIGEQIRAHRELAAAPTGPDAPIRAVVLTSADIDCAAGLLSLRNGPVLDIYATPSVFEDLTSGLPLLSVLGHYCGVRWHLLGVAGEQHRFPFQIDALGSLRFDAVALPGRAPPYSAHRNDPSAGDRIALRVFDPATNRRFVYAPGLGVADADSVVDGLRGPDCVLLDASVGTPAAAGSAGAAVAWPGSPARARRGLRRVLLHLRGGDPLLDEDSRERHALAARGIEIGYDGMEIRL